MGKSTGTVLLREPLRRTLIPDSASSEGRKKKKVPVPGKKTLVPDSASSEGRAIRQVEILSNKLLTTAFEASLECVTVM